MKRINIFKFACIFFLALCLICPVGVKAAGELDVSLDVIPSTCGPATQVSIQGIVNINDGTPAKGSAVFINVTGAGGYLDEHTTTSDATGHYSISITAPSIPGTYEINVTAIKSPLTGWNDTFLEILAPRPDMAILDGIVISDITPNENDKVSISCNVTNQGKVLGEANVTFYDGDPSLKGLEFYRDNISLAADTSIIVSMVWTAIVGPHTIYVVIENCTPDDSNASNNQALVLLEVQDITLPQIHNVSINPQGPTSADNITISMNVTDNYGMAKQNAVLVNYTVDNGTEQSFNATILSSGQYQAIIGPYPANSQIYFKVIASDQSGNVNTSNQYYLNINYSFIDIQLGAFFQIYEQDTAMQINGAAMLDGQSPVVKGDVFVSVESMTDVWTTITDDDGAFSVQIMTPSNGGEYTLNISIISSNIDKTVNTTFTVYGDAPDLQIKSSDIEILAPNPMVGDAVEILVTVHNVGKLNSQANISIYLGDPANNGTLIYRSEALIPAGDSNTSSFLWYAESAGMQEIWVMLQSDGSERILTNNAIAQPLFVSQPESQEYGLISLLIITNIILAAAVVALAARLRSHSKNGPAQEKKESEFIDE